MEISCKKRGKMVDVLLVHPLEYKKNIFTKIKEKHNIPISIWYLGSYLRSQGISVALIDFESDANALKKLKEKGKNVLLIGITMMTSQVGHGLSLAKFIKEEVGNIPIVVGGVHPTLYPEETIQSKYIEFAVYGEGEIALLELIQSIKDNSQNFSHIQGLAFKNKNKIFFKKEKTGFLDHSNYPNLDYSLLGKKILDTKNKRNNSMTLVTSRGCPYKCLFCINSVIKERTEFQSWSIEKIVYEVKRALDLGFSDIFFWDDNFFQSKKRLIRFLEEIKKFGKRFTWFGNVRADCFNERYLSVELLSELNKYGLTRVSIGAESGSQRMLDYMKKGIKVEHIIKAAEYCVKANIEPSFSFMIGMPKEESEDIYLTVECMRQLCNILPLPKILGPMLYLPLPGSKMFDACIESGFKPPQTIEGWAKIQSGYGFSAYKRLWISNPDMVRIIWFYSFLITASYRKINKVIKKYSNIVGYSKIKELTLLILVILGSVLGKTRYKFKFFKLPAETAIFEGLRSLSSM